MLENAEIIRSHELINFEGKEKITVGNRFLPAFPRNAVENRQLPTDLFLDSVGAGWDWILIGRVLVQWALAFWIMVRFADLRRDYMPEETMEDIQ